MSNFNETMTSGWTDAEIADFDRWLAEQADREDIPFMPVDCGEPPF